MTKYSTAVSMSGVLREYEKGGQPGVKLHACSSPNRLNLKIHLTHGKGSFDITSRCLVEWRSENMSKLRKEERSIQAPQREKEEGTDRPVEILTGGARNRR